jgi:hypothetical protein
MSEEERKARKREHNKAYREANKEKIAARNKAYYEANREKILKERKAYHEANRERVLKKRKAYREANRDSILDYNRKYLKTYREANKEKIAARNKAYYEANKDSYLARTRKRQCLIKKVIPKPLRKCPIETDRLVKIYKLRSIISEATGVEHHVDHMWPLSDGGPHWSGNLQIITATENLSKSASVCEETKKVIKESLEYALQEYKKEKECT